MSGLPGTPLRARGERHHCEHRKRIDRRTPTRQQLRELPHGVDPFGRRELSMGGRGLQRYRRRSALATPGGTAGRPKALTPQLVTLKPLPTQGTAKEGVTT